jgi:hypothetical protein
MYGVAAAALLWAGGAARAEEDMKDKAQWRVEKLTKVLELTPEQQTQLRQIADEYQDKRKALKDQLEALRQDEDAKVRALLSADQQAKFDRWRERKEERRKERLERRREQREQHTQHVPAPAAGEGQ